MYYIHLKVHIVPDCRRKSAILVNSIFLARVIVKQPAIQTVL